MRDAQRFVFTALAAAIAIDLGSFSKFKQIWSLAFTGTPGNKSSTQQPYSIHAPGTQAHAQNTHVSPDKSGNCPSGYHLTEAGECVPNVGPHAAP